MVRLHAVTSWYDSRMGLVTLDDDVLSIVRQIRESYGEALSVELDEATGWYHLVEHTQDGTDRLVFSTSELDGRVLERLAKADSQWRHHEDPYDAAEREQDQEQAAIDAAYREKLQEIGEEMAFSLKREGKMGSLPLTVAPHGKRYANR
jgi:hypothetical protein